MLDDASKTNTRPGNWFGAAIAHLNQRRERRQARSAVLNMPDHMLRDLGYTREGLLHEIDHPR